MDKGKIHSLNPYHVIGLVLNTIIGVNLLSLAHTASKMGYNSWWLPLLMGAVAQLTLFPMVVICRRYPEDSLFVINEKLLGKWIGRFMNMLIVVYAFLMAAAVNDSYMRLVQNSMLSSQTITLPLLALVLVMLYIVLGGIKLIARFCILSFFFTGWMIFYLQWGYKHGGILHIFPLFNVGISDLLKAFHLSYPSMLGYEVLLIYFPYIQRKEKALLHASIGLWMVVLIYVFVLLTSVSYFSQWQMSNLIYPILNLFKAVELSFLERVENLGIGLWVFLTLSTATTYLWMAHKGMEEIMRKQSLWYLYLLTVASYFTVRGNIPMEVQRYLYDKLAIYMAYGLLLWPLFLLLLDALRKGYRGKAT